MEVFCLRLVTNKSSVFSAQRSTSFQNLYCVLARYTRNPNQSLHRNKDWSGSKHLRNTETWTELTASQWNSSGIFSQEQLSQEVKDSLLRLNETPEKKTGRIIFMSMFNDISWRSRDNKVECESNANLVSLYARRFVAGQWSFLVPGSEKKWYTISEDSPQDEWDTMAELMMLKIRRKWTSSLPCYETIVERSAQKQRRWKVVDTLLCRLVND